MQFQTIPLESMGSKGFNPEKKSFKRKNWKKSINNLVCFSAITFL